MLYYISKLFMCSIHVGPLYVLLMHVNGELLRFTSIQINLA